MPKLGTCVASGSSLEVLESREDEPAGSSCCTHGGRLRLQWWKSSVP